MRKVKRDHKFEDCIDPIETTHRIGTPSRCDACRIQRFTLGDVEVIRTDKANSSGN
jgi:hypothetical protein